MPMIPPHERYNQHINKSDLALSLIEKSLVECGLNPQTPSIHKLSGGFQNSNYLVEANQQKIVLRFYSTDLNTALREIGILRFLKKREIKAPAVVDFFEIEGKPVAALEFVEGTSLQEKVLRSSHIEKKMFFLLGQELARIHCVELPRPGFIGPEMKIGNEYENFGSFLKGYIIAVFKSVSSDRLESSIRDRLLKLVEDKWPVVLTTEPASHLVHCDFNPKNIMVSTSDTPVVTGVLDWEFSLSGNGHIDIGNFFRFPYDYPESAQETFIEGYKSIQGGLSENWKEVSMLMDLGNMASFMERKEDYQKTFQTARAVINSTLNYFGY